MFGDGLQTRDYVYVGDVVEANLLAADANATGAFNIGTGVETSVLDLVEALAGHADADVRARAWRRSGPARCATSPSTPRRAKAELGWRPRSSSSDGLERTLDSLR